MAVVELVTQLFIVSNFLL